MTGKTLLGARILIIRNSEVLLVRHTYTQDWFLPGGGVEKGESFLQAAQRELREECGVEAHDIRLFGLYRDPKLKAHHIAVYVAQKIDTIREFKPNLEIEESRFYPLNDLPDRLSPATRRRLSEYRSQNPTSDIW